MIVIVVATVAAAVTTIIAAIVILAVLVGLAYDCADACACGSADEGSFKAAAEESAQNRSAARADQRTLAGPNAALIAIMVAIVIIVLVIVLGISAVAVVVLATAGAVADTVVEVRVLILVVVIRAVVPVSIVAVLGACAYRKKARSQDERGDEYSFAYLHHSWLDANS